MKTTNVLFRFFLTNETWAQSLVKNTVWAGIAQGIGRLLRIVTTLLMARYLGPAEYGGFAFAFSFVTLFNVITDGGLLLVATKEFSTNRENNQFLPDILILKILLGLFGCLMMGLGMLLVTDDPMVRTIIVILGIYLFALELGSISYAIFRSRQKMEYETAVLVTQSILLFGGVLLALWMAPSAVGVSYAHLGAGLLSLGLIGLAFRWRGWRLEFRLRWGVLKRLFLLTLPLGLVGVLNAVYMNIDSVMLGYSGRIIEVGWYNAAVKTIFGFVLVPMSLTSVVSMPAFASMSAKLDTTFRKRWDTWTAGMILIGSYLTTIVLATSHQLVILLFGETFSSAGTVLEILALTAIMMYLYMPYYQAVIVFEKQSKLFWSQLLGALVNVIMNVILIPRYGLYGAAWSAVGTHAVVLLVLFFLTSKYTPLKPVTQVSGSALLASAISGALTYTAMILTDGNPFFSIPLGTIVFVACILGLKRIKEAVWATTPTLPM